jgi:hypothetical protein
MQEPVNRRAELLMTAAFVVRYGCNGTVDEGCTDTRCQVAVVTKFCVVVLIF